jgi:hypothetical protein
MTGGIPGDAANVASMRENGSGAIERSPFRPK